MTANGYDIRDMSACEARVPGSGVVLPPASEANVSKADAAALGKQRLAAQCKDAPVIGTITWAQLGLSGAGDLSRQEVLVSTDGTHWSSVAAPDTGPFDNLVATDDGFLLLA